MMERFLINVQLKVVSANASQVVISGLGLKLRMAYLISIRPILKFLRKPARHLVKLRLSQKMFQKLGSRSNASVKAQCQFKKDWIITKETMTEISIQTVGDDSTPLYSP